ncbi:prolyl 4-hydroxylase subunit alpha-2 isoform X2 [Drosophila eugracilis]|uniref:prolyl 4-hydroxylase subunit alpha-2 isoform X2 n=1 Tax=Drosophila eugracilis TaxID=29029 RepID=UPI001BD954E2|nr:prolyl 4-hydroxylase subunit alpha-2 isoform X2 [Drosophila eugracilis]
MRIGKLLLVIVSSLSLRLGRTKDIQQRYARSVVNMDELLKTEEDLVHNLEEYTARLSKKGSNIRWWIRQMEELHQKGNPVNSFSLIRHMQADWLMWKQYLEKPVGVESVAFIKSKNSALPQEDDMMDAAIAMRRMQATYKMEPSDIAKGLLDGVQYNSSLASIDCLAMARHLMNEWRWTTAEQWILTAIESLDRVGSPSEMQSLRGPTQAELFRALGQVRVEKRNTDGALTAYQAALKHSPHDSEIFEEYQSIEVRVLTSPPAEPIKEEPDDDIEEMELPPCCSGRCEVPQKLRRLYCVYNHVTSPFLKLAPIKTEILSVDPFMILYHDMVTAKEGVFLRSSSKGLLLPSQTINYEKKLYEIAKFRTSKSTWLDNDANQVTLRLTERLADATGLNINHSEPFHVINYGIGGFFESHYDVLFSDENRFLHGQIDRMATTLFYLNDVPQGGGTYFPGVNITVFPRFGTVLFWYNIDTKGDQQIRTMHSGCPVIVGSKWVVSKWVNANGQEFRRPCLDLNSHSKYMPSVEKLIKLK